MDKKTNKLRRIGWLMMVSELVLLLFASVWINGQYVSQKEMLHQNLQTTFDKTYEGLWNHVLDLKVDSMLADTSQLGPHVDEAFSMMPDGVNADNADSMMEAMSRHSRGPGMPPHNGAAMIGINVGEDNGIPQQLPADVKKMFRKILDETIKSPILNRMHLKASIDSVKLKQAFSDSIHKTLPSLQTIWSRDTAIQTFSFKSAATTFMPIEVTGHKSYLFKKILPQIGFILFLLSLIGIAFWMAYNNIKQQNKFAEQKDSFISNISHELKTPVATTKVALEALSTYHAIDDPERTRRYLNVAALEMERLAALISRILNTVQTESGMINLVQEEINLLDLLKNVEETLMPIIQAKNIQLIWENTPSDIILMGDRIHLTGVFYNLIDNAIKYGDGIVTIDVTANHQNANISITNTGATIPEEYKQKVFEKFFRIPDGDKHNIKGHGLGLSYARYVIRAHGGVLSLDSSSELTKFIITIPKFNH